VSTGARKDYHRLQIKLIFEEALLFVFEMAYQVTPLTTMPGAKPWRLSGEYRSSERLPQAPNKSGF